MRHTWTLFVCNANDMFTMRLSQVDMSTTRKYGGTGLGLSIVKTLVEAHNSTVEISSKLGQGTSFSFSLKVGGQRMHIHGGQENSSCVAQISSNLGQGTSFSLSLRGAGQGQRVWRGRTKARSSSYIVQISGKVGQEASSSFSLGRQER